MYDDFIEEAELRRCFFKGLFEIRVSFRQSKIVAGK